MRFCLYKVAVTADAEKAFMMVLVEEGDRFVLRFLWVNDINEDKIKIRLLEFTRVVFEVYSNLYLLSP